MLQNIFYPDLSSMKRRFFCFCRSFFACYDSCVANFTVEDNSRQPWMTAFCALNMPDTDQVLCPLANWLYTLCLELKLSELRRHPPFYIAPSLLLLVMT